MSRPRSPLAIVGLSCLLPGARDEQELWELLWEGRDAVTELPPERLDRDLYFDPEPGHPCKTYTLLAGMVPEIELESQPPGGDPCHRVLTQVARRAWRQAAPPESSRVGVYVGHAAGSELAGEVSFGERIESALRPFGAKVHGVAEQLKRAKPAKVRGLEPRQAASRVARALRVQGPAVVVDAACASSLVALASAALALDEGAIDCALVAGASYAKGDSLVLFSHARSCSARGSRPFDDAADGLVGSEGYVCLVVQRLDDALARGASIRAVIRGIGMASDGRGRSLWAPRVEGQCLALRRAYQDLDPARVEYVEAHATSTQVGDATELEALGRFFRPHLKGRKLPIGSIKSNLGHTLETAGLASLVKVVLAFEKKAIPASIKVDQLNTGVDWDTLPLEVVRRSRDWVDPGMAGVSAFGIGGLNVHVVLEPPPMARLAPAGLLQQEQSDDPVVLVGAGMVGEGISSWRQRAAGGRPRGRLKSYHFDGLELRIPPRLMERSDPLGFMLLDAAGQALAGNRSRPEQTAVVVATSFGNFFSEQLQLGLRVPEISSLLRSRMSAAEVEAFEKEFLERYPAVLDETGSFTPSSLASRIAKAYDLMGGAATLDSGARSSHEALGLARRLLNSGQCQAVLCCAGERCRKHPTEGSVALLLKLRSLALADGDPILGILDDHSGKTPAGPFGAAQGLCEVLLANEPRPASVCLRYGAQTEAELSLAVERGQSTGFSPTDRYRTTILAPDEATLAKRTRLAATMAGQPRALEEQAIYRVRLRGRRPKVAFCFAGQGSQSQGMLQTLVRGTPALAEADRRLAALGLPSFADMAWSENPDLDQDPVVTQISLLVADWLMLGELERRGFQPDYVWGHSFGEFAALVAARALTLEQALRLTRIRAEALARSPVSGGLVSVAAGPDLVGSMLQGTELTITHCNSPEQTVVGGKIAELALLEIALQREGVDFRRLRVPGALHTELSRHACEPLRQALEKEQIRPPDRMFVSNVGNRYTTEPEDIKANLVRQLVEPVRYQRLVERMVGDGVEILVEVGPGRTLTSLHRQILGQAPVVLLSTDHPRRHPLEQLERVELVFEALEPGAVRARPVAPRRPSAPEDFDATAARRGRKPTRPSHSDESSGRWKDYLLDLVVDLTGYPREAIDLEWDLEADLGLDSIKQTALFAELADLSGQGDGHRLFKAELRTLQQVLEWLSESSGPASEPPPEPDDDRHARGLELGRRYRQEIRRWLRQLALDREPGACAAAVPAEEFEKGLAQGAGVLAANLVAHRGRPFPWEESVTSRHVIRMRELPLPVNGPSRPLISGAVLVMGNGPLTRRVLQGLGAEAFMVSCRADLEAIKTPLPHLLLTLAAEPGAETDLERWPERRELVREVYWVCQEWYRRLLRQGLAGQASLTALTRLGGELGVTGRVESAEGGALTGLLKGLAVEQRISGGDRIAIRAIDLDPDLELEAMAATVLREMAVSRYDLEVCWRHGRRLVPWLVREPLDRNQKAGRRPSGCWVMSGGARGVTAEAAYELWHRYQLKIHILGRASAPSVDAAWRDAWRRDDKSGLKRLVTEHAREQGLDSMQAWRETEKALQLEETLARIPGTAYHSVDVSDGLALRRVLAEIRAQDGPIRGVLHGAGVIRDDRFDLKVERWVEENFRAKLDGTIELMRATWDDPLEYFVAFGSVSGRFGASAQTDYCMGNDMMAKLVDWYRSQRPEVAAVTFHWHAWDGVGMATRPSAKLALELLSFRCMPLQEGLSHLVRELEAGAPEPEVVITDERQCRIHDPNEPDGAPSAGEPGPMLCGATAIEGGWSLQLDPRREPFLHEHRVQGFPVLPLAFALEVLGEGALETRGVKRTRGLVVEDIRAEEIMTFRGEGPRGVRVLVDGQGLARLLAETSHAATNGDGQRVICSGRVRPAEPPSETMTLLPDGPWIAVDYNLGLAVTHGPPLRGLKAWQMLGPELWGLIVVPPIPHLLHFERARKGWLVPSSLLDACFYAVGVYLYIHRGQTAVPRSLRTLRVGRPPQPGEACMVRLRATGEGFDFAVWGEDGATLLIGLDYQVSPLSQPNATLVKSR